MESLPRQIAGAADVFDIMLGQVRSELPNATWRTMGTGHNQLLVNEWTLVEGGLAALS
jgi:hypothetical protein